MTLDARRILMRSSAVIMFATLISRIFGLVRMQVINYYFEQSLLDPFWSAFKIPNTLRELLGEGALSVAFIPVFTAILLHKGNDEANKLASNVFNVLFVVVASLVLVGVLLAEVYMPAYVSGFADDLYRVSLAVDMAMIMMPFLLFASMGAVVMGVLNGHKHFAAPAFAPILFTVGMVGTIVLFHDSLGVMSLAWGVLAGGLLQFAVQLPWLKKSGFKHSWRFNLKDKSMRDVLMLMGPAALALGVVQINQLMAPFFASFVEGGMAALQNSILLIQMPQGVFAVAVSTALLPTLSEQAARLDFKAFRGSMRDGLGLVLLFTLPASMFFLFMGTDVVDSIFNLGGKFSTEGVQYTARALFFYTFGLIGMGSTVLANRFFYSLRDMKTPFWVACISVSINLTANILFHVFEWGFEYIAMANSIAVTVNFVVLLILIQRRAGRLPWQMIMLDAAKITIASSVMMLIVFGIKQLLGSLPVSIGLWPLIRLCIAGSVGVPVFFLVCKLLQVQEVHILYTMIKGRISRKGRK